MESKQKISIVIPALNEEKNITQLVSEIIHEFKTLPNTYEIIVVNDGSKDGTQSDIDALIQKHKNITGIELRRQKGKAAALKIGFKHASGDIIMTMDGDLQDDPREISQFIEKINEGYDFVSGWKQNRKDSFIKNKTSLFFNFINRSIFGLHLHDFNSGYKAYKKEIVEHLPLYGELHRYIPIFVHSEGYKIAEIPVHHRKRKYGSSKYGLNRFIHGYLDLTTVIFLTKFSKSPLHFFGYIGSLSFLIGFLIGLYLTFIKIGYGESIGNRPLLLFSVMLMIMGVQIAVTGILGEQIMNSTYAGSSEKSVKKIVSSKS